jgi:hypothetical protein
MRHRLSPVGGLVLTAGRQPIPAAASVVGAAAAVLSELAAVLAAGN